MSKNILIIDDEEIVVESIKRLLEREGYDVSIAKSGLEALGKVKEKNFDLIISDVRMPESDGVETIEQVRGYLKDANKKAVPEILITGYADMEKYKKAIALKVADYLYKPFDIADLLRAVKKVIG